MVFCKKPPSRRKEPRCFEVVLVTPPQKTLGVQAYEDSNRPHCGKEIEVDGQGFVVTAVVFRKRLFKGRYVHDSCKLEVQKTERYFTNLLLEGLYEKEA